MLSAVGDWLGILHSPLSTPDCFPATALIERHWHRSSIKDHYKRAQKAAPAPLMHLSARGPDRAEISSDN